MALQNKKPDLILFYRAALAEWVRLAAAVDGDIGYVRRGGLRVAASAEDVETLGREVSRQKAVEGITLNVYCNCYHRLRRKF